MTTTTATPTSPLRGPLIVGAIAAILSVLGYAGSTVVARSLLTTDDTPPQVGSTITLFIGMLILGAASARSIRKDIRAPRRALLWITLAGILASTGAFLSFFSLDLAPVVLVSPIFTVNPLVTLVLAAVFLRQVERITLRVFIGAILVVAGVILVILSNQ